MKWIPDDIFYDTRLFWIIKLSFFRENYPKIRLLVSESWSFWLKLDELNLMLASVLHFGLSYNSQLLRNVNKV